MKIEMRSSLVPFPLPKDDMRLLGCLLQKAAAGEGKSRNTSIAILFTDDAGIRKYNKKYRKLDKATDVLSFPMYEWKELRGSNFVDRSYRVELGDIIISLDRCRAQAREYGHSEQRELCFLGLHGFLHLVGYDHVLPGEAEIMESVAEKYLASLGVVR